MQSLIQSGEITDPDVIARNKEEIAMIERRRAQNKASYERYREKHRDALLAYYKAYRRKMKGEAY